MAKKLTTLLACAALAVALAGCSGGQAGTSGASSEPSSSSSQGSQAQSQQGSQGAKGGKPGGQQGGMGNRGGGGGGRADNDADAQAVIDANRIYATGQSMGCMSSPYLNSAHPGFFAASMYVSGQWDISVLKGLADQKFFYIVAGGDEKASAGQDEVMAMLDADGVPYSFGEWDAQDTQDEQDAAARALVAEPISAIGEPEAILLPGGSVDAALERKPMSVATCPMRKLAFTSPDVGDTVASPVMPRPMENGAAVSSVFGIRNK